LLKNKLKTLKDFEMTLLWDKNQNPAKPDKGKYIAISKRKNKLSNVIRDKKWHPATATAFNFLISMAEP
jgi:hypothetical protein